MTVRELINKLMDMNLDKDVYITQFCDNKHSERCVGYVGDEPIEIAALNIVDVDVHGLYGVELNCITVR